MYKQNEDKLIELLLHCLLKLLFVLLLPSVRLFAMHHHASVSFCVHRKSHPIIPWESQARVFKRRPLWAPVAPGPETASEEALEPVAWRVHRLKADETDQDEESTKDRNTSCFWLKYRTSRLTRDCWQPQALLRWHAGCLLRDLSALVMFVIGPIGCQGTHCSSGTGPKRLSAELFLPLGVMQGCLHLVAELSARPKRPQGLHIPGLRFNVSFVNDDA